jgi:ATP-dependent RNA helicase DHX57
MAIAVAAGMSAGRSPFLRINSPYSGAKQGSNDGDSEKEFINKRILEERASVFKSVGNSDHAMLGKVLLLWQECQGASEKRRFCDKLGLAFNSMREMNQLSNQLDSSLTTSGFIPSKACNKNESSWRVVRSAIVAALSPTQIVRVQRPTTKYTETVEGAVEKEGKAKELKFFIRGGCDVESDNNVDNDVGQSKKPFNPRDERVFIHPSSNNFTVGAYSCPWLVYHRLVRTSKAFISDATECNAYALLLFGGPMEVQASKGLIVLDEWVQLSANARIGSLIGALRQKVDDLLEKKVADPSLDITGTAEMKLITDLLRQDGLG